MSEPASTAAWLAANPPADAAFGQTPDVAGAAARASARLRAMLDFLRGIFVYVVAIALPLAGVILAAARLAHGDRDEALRIAAASLLGGCVYALALT